MSRKVGIILSLVIALIFTGLINYTSNKKYNEVTKSVTVYRAAKFIPQGTTITDSEIEADTTYPDKLSDNLVKDKKDIVGKAATVSMLANQLIYKGSTSTGAGKKPGYVEMFLPTDLSTSALAMPGDYVNIIPVSDNGEKVDPLMVNAQVTYSLDQDGNNIDPSEQATLINSAQKGKRIPVSVGVLVPADLQAAIAQFAYKKKVYLVKSDYMPKQ